LPVDGDVFEICDECGFDAVMVGRPDVVARLRSLGDRWAAVFANPAELLRARPAPETWCAVEYAEHVTYALGAIEWAAGEFVAGRSPDWDAEPKDLAGQFEHESHDCERFDVSATLRELDAAAHSMAGFAEQLTAEELGRTANYTETLVLTTAAVVRHALHDAEHHLLDIRRGIAGLRLAASA
jgi:S-DNA-T family DNA segregation ATPase FtsK/SpoIIIE